jgi:hypothetical protein
LKDATEFVFSFFCFRRTVFSSIRDDIQSGGDYLRRTVNETFLNPTLLVLGRGFCRDLIAKLNFHCQESLFCLIQEHYFMWAGSETRRFLLDGGGVGSLKGTGPGTNASRLGAKYLARGSTSPKRDVSLENCAVMSHRLVLETPTPARDWSLRN